MFNCLSAYIFVTRQLYFLYNSAIPYILVQVAEEELQRELSNAGTDKFSDDEPMVFPVQGYRESLCETSKTPAKYLEEDPAPKVAVPAPSGGKSKEESAKSKTCAIQ